MNAKKVLLPCCLIWSGPVGYEPLDYKLHLPGETAKAKKSGTGSELAGYMEDWGKGSQQVVASSGKVWRFLFFFSPLGEAEQFNSRHAFRPFSGEGNFG